LCHLASFPTRRSSDLRQTPLDFGDRTGPFTVPVRIVGNKVLVRGRVNGGTPVDFVLDTGSEQVVLSGRVAARAGVRPVTYVQSRSEEHTSELQSRENL